VIVPGISKTAIRHSAKEKGSAVVTLKEHQQLSVTQADRCDVW